MEESLTAYKNPTDILRYDARSKNYFYTGNIIANALEAKGYSESQLYNDIFTIAAEDVIRENFGYYFYDRPLTDLPNIQDQLERAVDLTNPQIPFYELQRNQQNYINNMHLVNARFDSSSPFHAQPFIEVSPPPESDDVFLQQQIHERGYTNFSYLLVSIRTMDENGNMIERAVQLWIDKLDETKWNELFQGLKKYSDIAANQVAGFSNGQSIYYEQFGADIIGKGGFMNESQLRYLQQFLSDNEIEARFDDLNEVAMIQNNFKQVIESRMGNDIRQIIDTARDITSFDEMQSLLSQLSNKIIALHNEIRLFIRDIFDKPFAHYDYSQTYATFNQLSDGDRSKIVQEKGYSIKYCGGSQSSSNTMLGKLGLNNGELLTNRIYGERSPRTPDLSEPCNDCGGRWWLKEGDTNTYRNLCPHCGSAISNC